MVIDISLVIGAYGTVLKCFKERLEGLYIREKNGNHPDYSITKTDQNPT